MPTVQVDHPGRSGLHDAGCAIGVEKNYGDVFKDYSILSCVQLCYKVRSIYTSIHPFIRPFCLGLATTEKWKRKE